MDLPSAEEQEEIVHEALKRFERAVDADREQRALAMEDVRFVELEDAQWTDEAKKARKDRPCMTFDRVSGALDQIRGDFLQNRPGLKIRASEDGDAELAEVYTGLIRNIESSSNSKRAYSTAFKFTTAGGFGAWRIDRDYQADDSFDQDIIINPIHNPFTVFFDPSADKVTKEDGKFCFVIQDFDKDEFEKKWPDAQMVGSQWDVEGLSSDWFTDDEVRIAEYFRKVDEERTLVRLSDGAVHFKDEIEDVIDDLANEGITIDAERPVVVQKVEHYLITGSEILEAYECVSRYIPIIPVFGKNVNVDGRFRYRGVVRKAKDAQRFYNYELSNLAESSALQPKQPYLATPEMIEGHEEAWSNINVRNDPVLLFNGPQAPQRNPPSSPSGATITAMNFAADNIKSQTGIFDASLGARSNETSGKAIMERDRQGDTATFEFTDEVVEALEYSGRVIVDMIPKVYDSQRMVRILGEDEAEDVVEINKQVRDLQTGQVVTLNDLSKGKYDVVVKTGAAYSTKRTETAEQLAQIMAQNPEIGMMISDVYFKSLDLVGGDEVQDRVRKFLINKGLVEPTEEEQKEMMTPEKQQAKKMEQQLKSQAGQLELADKQADVKKKNAEAEKIMAEIMDTKADTNYTNIKAAVEQLALQQANQQQMMSQLLNAMAGRVMQ